MKKALIVLALLLAVFAPLTAEEKPGKPIITVLDFKMSGGVSESEMRQIISLLSSSLFQTAKYTVIDVTQRENILKEIEFSATGCTDESCQLKIGKLLAAEMIVVGNIGTVGKKYVMSTKLLETESGKTLATADGIYASLDEILDDFSNLSAKLTGTTPAEAPKAAATAEKKEPEKKEPAKAPQKAAVAKVQKAPAAPASGKKIAGIASLVVGIACLGTGGYFLFDGLVNEAAWKNEAWDAYIAATMNFDALYAEYVDAVAAYRQSTWLGIGLTTGGLGLSALGTVLLLPPKTAAPSPKVSILPGPRPGTTLLSLSIAY
ncbi:MAG: hypothetical protein NT005_00505 [Spirochaetes bacterium]|nr:hypothetical protein [Spirochaetota bacterium]